MARQHKSTATQKAQHCTEPVSGSIRFSMMLVAVCLVYAGIAFGDRIHDFFLQLTWSAHIIGVVENIGQALGLKAQTLAGLTKAAVMSIYLLPAFTLGCGLISRRNKYLKMSAIPFLSVSMGISLKLLFGWRF